MSADPQSSEPKSDSTLDAEEIARFSRIAAEWWDPYGKFRPLHQIGPPRLAFVREAAVRHFGLDGNALRPLQGLSALDIGCGGGLVSEPLRRMGATVVGLDPAERNVEIARRHAAEQNLDIDYRASRVEDLVAAESTFDIVVCLEVIEHVPDVGKFMTQCASLVRPGGLAIFSTLNRTFKSWALAIVGAEYLLRWLPRGTHQWDRFVTPDEMARHADLAGLRSPRFEGMIYDPFKDTWSLAADTDVNYLASFSKAALT